MKKVFESFSTYMNEGVNLKKLVKDFENEIGGYDYNIKGDEITFSIDDDESGKTFDVEISDIEKDGAIISHSDSGSDGDIDFDDISASIDSFIGGIIRHTDF